MGAGESADVVTQKDIKSTVEKLEQERFDLKVQIQALDEQYQRITEKIKLLQFYHCSHSNKKALSWNQGGCHYKCPDCLRDWYD